MCNLINIFVIFCSGECVHTLMYLICGMTKIEELALATELLAFSRQKLAKGEKDQFRYVCVGSRIDRKNFPVGCWYM